MACLLRYFTDFVKCLLITDFGVISLLISNFGPKFYWLLIFGPKLYWLAIYGPKFYCLAILEVPHSDPPKHLVLAY